MKEKLKKLVELLQLLLWQLQHPKNKQYYISVAKQYADMYRTDGKLLCAVIEAESGWNPKAINRNINGTTDYGICQINDYWWIGEDSRSAKIGGYSFPSVDYVMNEPEMCISWMAEQFSKGRARDWCAYSNGSYIKFLKNY